MMAQPEVQMSHLDGGEGGGKDYTKHGVIVGAGRREHEPVPPSGNTALPPSAPLSPGPAPAPGGNWDGGWEWDSGVGGAEWGSSIPHPPPPPSGSGTCTGLATQEIISPLSPHHLTPISNLRGERCRSCRAPGRGRRAPERRGRPGSRRILCTILLHHGFSLSRVHRCCMLARHKKDPSEGFWSKNVSFSHVT